MLFSFLVIAFFAFCGLLQANYNEKHVNKDELRRQRETKKMYKRIESEAYRKYPNVLHWKEREEYIERRLNGEDPE